MLFWNKKRYDFLAIGDIVTDAFIRLKQAEVQDSIDHSSKELCVTFGDKVPYEFVKVVRGVGNSANAAVSAARLGLNAGLIANIGDDQDGRDMLDELSRNNVDTRYIERHKNMLSNYHYVLWYDVERTILVKHQAYPYSLPRIAPPRWLYLSSLGENTLPYHLKIAEFLEKNPEVQCAFQPGTFQMKMGVDALRALYKRTTIFFCNKEEAMRILKTPETDLKTLMKMLADLGPKIVVITDGIKGAYAFDGTDTWFMPVYPQDPYERTGAGDAFASSVTAALALGLPLYEALRWGPANSAGVIQKIGAQEGLQTRKELEKMLERAPADYHPIKV